MVFGEVESALMARILKEASATLTRLDLSAVTWTMTGLLEFVEVLEGCHRVLERGAPPGDHL